jgi:hypothetical protein
MGRITAKFLVVALAMWFPARSMAQQGTTSSPSQDHPSPAPTRTAEITIRGCVAGGKRYSFIQASTGAMFALTGKTDRFAPVRGKLIEITADEFAPQGKSNEFPTLRVNNLRVIADKCPIQARPAPRRVIPSSAYQGPPASPNTTPYADPGTVSQTPPNVDNPNVGGATGAPSPGTGNPPSQPQK